ncbi:HK97-gp10 family putative phage morphogenesis protein [Chitinimonas sp.]|uniref:HK97-gp10 family putative phage morphogenesis protein n=1 Tax=Chitinimonas sp. TaxID=1934313 RepID=UPI0035B2B176
MADLAVQGLAELGRALDGLGPKIERKLMRRALRAGAVLIRNAAIARVPKDSGAAQRSIRVVFRRGEPGVIVVNVVAGDLSESNQRKFGQKSAFYVRFLEYGTARLPARPFMRPALDDRASAAVEAIAGVLADGIEKEAAP